MSFSATRSRLFFFVFTLLVLVSLHPLKQARSEETGAVSSPPPSVPPVAPTGDDEKLSKLMEIFYINSKFRSPVDTIQIANGTVQISVWKSLPPEPEQTKIECSGYQWLLGGRGKKIGAGAGEVFRQFPSVNKIILELVDLEFGIKSADNKGKFERTAKKHSYLTMTASRGNFQNFSLKGKQLKSKLNGNLSECLKIGRSVITEKEIKL